jgi:predicted nucleic acid-binding protein
VRQLFLDTNYLCALLSDRDPLHAAAVHTSEELRRDTSVRYVTSLPVLTEILAHYSKDAFSRRTAADFIQRMRASDDVVVVVGDEQLFDAAIDLYRRRLDKTYSLVDCMSMVICRRMNITEVMTGDRDFQQEGFTILL